MQISKELAKVFENSFRIMFYTKRIKIISYFIVLLISVLGTGISNDIFQNTLNDIRKNINGKRILLVISENNNNSLIREGIIFFG